MTVIAPPSAVPLRQETGILIEWDDVISRAADVQQGNSRLRQRCQMIDRIELVVQSLRFVQAVDCETAFPVRRRTFGFPLPGRPAFKIAHRRVVVDAGYLRGIAGRPVERVKPSPAEAFEDDFRRELLLADDVFVKLVHVIEGRRCAVHVLHVEIRHMEAAGQQRQVRLRFVAKEFGPPDPRPPLRRRPGEDEKSGATVDDEIETLKAVPVRALHVPPQVRSRCRG